MVRCAVCFSLSVTAAALAQVAPATTPPSATAPATTSPAATRPAWDANALLIEGFHHMRAGDYAKARGPIDAAFAAAPFDQLPRAAILNHAILDHAQKVNVMRAVKHLRQYLAHRDDQDEEALAILGACLARAAEENPRVTSTDLFQSAVRTCDQARAGLEETRPRMRLWGARWIPRRQFADIEEQRRRAESRVEIEARELGRREADLAAARADFDRVNRITVGVLHVHNDRAHGPAGSCQECSRVRAGQQEADDARTRLARAEAEVATQRKAVEQAQSRTPRPDWPETFDPIDPAARAPTSTPTSAPSSGRRRGRNP